jgi:hypothetical protein
VFVDGGLEEERDEFEIDRVRDGESDGDLDSDGVRDLGGEGECERVGGLLVIGLCVGEGTQCEFGRGLAFELRS